MKTTALLNVTLSCALAFGVAFCIGTGIMAPGKCYAAEKSGADAKSEPAAKKDEPAAKKETPSLEEQKKTYPLDTCVVTGEKLGKHGEVVEHEYKGRLVRFCCKGCIGTFEKDPAKYLAKIDEAAKKKADEAKPKSGGDASKGK